MKLLIGALLLTGQFQAHAKGFDCSAFCLEVDTSRSTIHLIGRMNVVAGTESAKKAHKLLEKKCRLNSHGGILVDKLDFRTSRTSSSHYSSEYSYRYSGYHFSYAGGWYSEYERHTHQELDINLSPSRLDVACEVDNEVEDGDLPYVGRLEIL